MDNDQQIRCLIPNLEPRTTDHEAMRSHKDLDVWKQAITLAKIVYQTTGEYPKEEMFGLVSQMRRAAVSIASNIAEGAARHGNKEFIQFLYVAVGSASELDTQLEISKAAGFIEAGKFDAMQEAVSRVTQMLYGLIRATKSKQTT